VLAETGTNPLPFGHHGPCQMKLAGAASDPVFYLPEAGRLLWPEVGVYLGPDPDGSGYLYCGQNPVRFVDPGGLEDTFFETELKRLDERAYRAEQLARKTLRLVEGDLSRAFLHVRYLLGKAKELARTNGPICVYVPDYPPRYAPPARVPRKKVAISRQSELRKYIRQAKNWRSVIFKSAESLRGVILQARGVQSEVRRGLRRVSEFWARVGLLAGDDACVSVRHMRRAQRAAVLRDAARSVNLDPQFAQDIESLYDVSLHEEPSATQGGLTQADVLASTGHAVEKAWPTGVEELDTLTRLMESLEIEVNFQDRLNQRMIRDLQLDRLTPDMFRRRGLHP